MIYTTKTYLLQVYLYIAMIQGISITFPRAIVYIDCLCRILAVVILYCDQVRVCFRTEIGSQS